MIVEIFLVSLLVHSIRTNTRTISFTTVVAFGDGNTDTGNVYNLTDHQWPLVPPYYKGCFTNGPVWIENLNISNILNYAYGDAAIDNDNLLTGLTGPERMIVPGIRQQIVTYLTDNNIAASDLCRTLYIIWAGGTEYLLNSSISADVVVESLLTTVYDLLVVQIKRLIVMNLPPLQAYPGMNGDRRLAALITEHNTYLQTNLTFIQSKYPTVSIDIFDLHTLVTKILSDKSINALNTIDACWNLSNYTLVSQCSDPDQYAFIDRHYFTRVIHRLIATNLVQFISTSSSRIFLSSKFSIFLFLILTIVNRS